jgi:hypothetical protein
MCTMLELMCKRLWNIYSCCALSPQITEMQLICRCQMISTHTYLGFLQIIVSRVEAQEVNRCEMSVPPPPDPCWATGHRRQLPWQPHCASSTTTLTSYLTTQRSTIHSLGSPPTLKKASSWRHHCRRPPKRSRWCRTRRIRDCHKRVCHHPKWRLSAAGH